MGLQQAGHSMCRILHQGCLPRIAGQVNTQQLHPARGMKAAYHMAGHGQKDDLIHSPGFQKPGSDTVIGPLQCCDSDCMTECLQEVAHVWADLPEATQ